jgi:hypothetical protein
MALAIPRNITSPRLAKYLFANGNQQSSAHKLVFVILLKGRAARDFF